MPKGVYERKPPSGQLVQKLEEVLELAKKVEAEQQKVEELRIMLGQIAQR